MHKSGKITDAFEDLAHALRVLLEAHAHAHRFGLLQVDRAEAVGNIETAYAGVLNSFHSLYDAMEHSPEKFDVDWYSSPQLATILTLRNARHHNHANKVRTIYTYYCQEAESIGSMEMYVLLDFPALEEGADTFEVYVSWADLRTLLSMPKKETRIRVDVAEAIREYLGVANFRAYAQEYELAEDRVFFNVIPLIVNAAISVVPQIKDFVSPRSMESKGYLGAFELILPADTKHPEVNCGPFVLMR